MDVDGALVDIDVAAPYPVEQLLAGKNPAGAFHQVFEQAELGRPEVDRTGRARHPLLLAVELEVADGQHHGDALGAGPAQQRADARQQFRHRERFDDVVVGAGGKAAHPLAFLAARGQHDDRQGLRLRPRPQPPAQFDAGQAGQHPVEHDQIGGGLAQPGVGVVAPRHRIDLVAFGFEVITQQRGQRLLVFHDQDVGTHPRSPISAALLLQNLSDHPWDAGQ